jgi:hypothetical protein
MIAANELRIGNYIYWDENQVFKISGITKAGCRFEDDNNQFRTHKRILPIPLTPEILEKCGMQKLNNSWIIDDGSRDEHGAVISGNYTFSLFGYNVSELYYGKFHVKHLHQLQNLYFFLTGKELIYKP